MVNKFLLNISGKYASKWVVLLFDICVVIFTFFLAYVIRSNFKFDFHLIDFLKKVPFVAITAGICFLIVGSHKGVVRHTGIKDVINVLIAVNTLATILFIVSFLTRKFYLLIEFDFSGSIIYIHLLLNIFFLISLKFLIKATYKEIISDFKPVRKGLIYGAGSSGIILYNTIQDQVQSNIKIIGFIDDDVRKIGKKIDRIQIFGYDDINDEFLEKNHINEIIVSIQNISPKKLLKISNYFLSKSIDVKIVPPANQWIDGDLEISQIKDVKIEDLLGREPISIESSLLTEEYNNKVILITGAAGSIGSEIARKLNHFKFSKLILVDNAESPLYDIQQEFVNKGYKNIETIITDVRNLNRLDEIFNNFRPDIIFHAAAYKHVPLMERNPYEALSVNVRGTINVADLAIKYCVTKFVLVSTDKAVNPTNVMGATKRMAELYINCLKNNDKTKFITTRFGNVLGSNGSVIPLFKKQIEAGGPLTLTHRDITRYFMTIPEACSLVLEAAAMGNGSEIFVFDMGEPIKIYDLAINMISLSGKKYPDDIDIKIIGLRPGEKIYEELLADGENTKPTYHEKIMIAKSKSLDINSIQNKIMQLYNSNFEQQNIELVAKIKDIIPEFVSNNSKFEVLDK